MCLKRDAIYWYFFGEIGSSTWSPDSWCRRFLRETAARKSDRSFIGPFLRDLFKVRYHCPWYLLFPQSDTICMVFLCKFVSLFALLFCPSDCESSFTIYWISEKSIVITCKKVHLESQLSCSISSTHSKPGGILFVPRSCRVEHHDCVFSLSRSSG